VGYYRLHIHCVGEGSPTVVLDAGLGGFSLDWSLVQPELAATTRVCAYDRAGYGWSDPSPQSRTPGQIVEELHTLLLNAGIEGPYMLVGHSAAGKHVRLYADRYPHDVVGMVLVDARHESVDANRSPEALAAEHKQQQQQQQQQQRFQRTLWVSADWPSPCLLGVALANGLADNAEPSLGNARGDRSTSGAATANQDRADGGRFAGP
jgi:pimeloyl-ACP methyl ester carboxylesterase